MAAPLVFSHSIVTCWKWSTLLSLLPPAPAGHHGGLIPAHSPLPGLQGRLSGDMSSRGGGPED